MLFLNKLSHNVGRSRQPSDETPTPRESGVLVMLEVEAGRLGLG